MITFICLFLPAVISVSIYEHFSKQALTAKGWVTHYAMHVLFINLFCFITKCFVLDTGSLPLYTLASDMTPNTAWKYIVMSVAFAVIISLFEIFCKKNIKIKVEENDEQK